MTETELLPIIAQIIGLVASLIAISSYQFKQVKTLFLFQLVSAILFTTHFAMLGAYCGAVQNFLAMLRGVVLVDKKGKLAERKWIFIALIALFVISGIVFYDGVFSILPIIAMIVSTVFMWTRDNKKLRIAQMFVVSPCWLTYNIHVFSISGIITECFAILSVIVSLIRFSLEKKKK